MVPHPDPANASAFYRTLKTSGSAKVTCLTAEGRAGGRFPSLDAARDESLAAPAPSLFL